MEKRRNRVPGHNSGGVWREAGGELNVNSEVSSIQIPQMRTIWLFPRLFLVAVLINYVWEIAQSPLYVGMENFNLVWWHCGLAALGDGLLVLLIYAAGW